MFRLGYLSFVASGLVASASVLPRGTGNNGRDELRYAHVAVFSVDGLHANDIDKWLSKGKSNISMMLEHGFRYTDAYTTFPSDSFPGSLAQFTGAFPRTTGVWYDDVWDRSLFAPGSNCAGSPGAEIVYDESIDKNEALLFSGGIDPAKLPMAKSHGKCSPLYPHQRSRVNTAWEVLVAAGKKTAYADKHPAYDIMRGPSGTGLTTGYFPEINWAGNPTDNVTACIKYDQLHVDAFIKWLDGAVPDNSEGSLGGSAPTLFGGNFQTVSVGQKTAGYVKGSLDFTPALATAIEFVDKSLGSVINKLKSKNLYESTLIFVCSKHGQAPIDPTSFKEVDPAQFTKLIGVPTNFITFDDIALVYLNHTSDLSKAVANLQAHKSELLIDDIIYGKRQVELGFGDATKDPAVPDIIVQPIEGVIYTTSQSKIAEHGGNSENDRHVACFAHNPRLDKKTFNNRVYTSQIAPTVLQVLGFDPNLLQGVKAEKTEVLSGFECEE